MNAAIYAEQPLNVSVEYWRPLYLQDDKDLVHEFVSNDGLECLIKVGMEADQKYQNYILRGRNLLSDTNLANLMVPGIH